MRILALSVLAGTAWGQAPVADLSPMLQGLPAKHKVPAVGLAVIRDFRLQGTGASGVRRRGAKFAATRDDRWHLGSCTKAMTATLYAALAKQGKVQFETKLATAFPKVKLHPGLAKVTVEDLFAHRAGVRRDANAGDLWAQLSRHTGPIQEARRLVVETILPAKPAFAPRTKMNYSNAGYMIAGAYIEKTLKASWEEVMRTRLFRPLGMNQSGFGPPGIERPDSQPWGHSNEGLPIRPGPGADNPAALGPAGTVHATLADWSKFVLLHLREKAPANATSRPTGESKAQKARAPKASPFLPFATIRRLHQPVGKGGTYAMGWSLAHRDWAGGRTLVHSGSNTMWYCVCWLAPEKGIAVLATCNQGGKAGAAACDAACVAALRSLKVIK